jgi:CRP-like cAMP-binding protein
LTAFVTRLNAEKRTRALISSMLNDIKSPSEKSSNPLILKLASLSVLDPEDRAILSDLTTRVSDVPAGTDLIREGDRPDGVYLIMEGFACRYKVRANGARQIMAYLVPGDFCDLDVALLQRMDHSIGTLSACKVVRMDLQTIQDLTKKHARITRALRTATLVDEATLREWLVNVGRRSAEERIAHLFCELRLRLEVVGCTHQNSYRLPVSQADLADTTGLSVVHVNRALQVLQGSGMIHIEEQQVRILDEQELRRLAEFRSNYLHLGAEAAA